MAKVLFVSKDIGGSKVIIPLALEVVKNGHDDIVITEGLAAQRFEQEEFPLYFKGTINFQKEPFSVNARSVLKHVEPDLVVVSLGSPIHLESIFVAAACIHGIPVVAVEDYWGGSTRLQTISPNGILTLDEYGKEIAEKRFPNAFVEIVGNSGISSVTPGVQASSFFDELKNTYECVYAFVGEGNSTTENLELLFKCLERTDANWCLIPRMHPKHEKDVISGTQETCGELWKRMLAQLGNRVVYAPDFTSDEVVACADATISSFGTLLTTAAYAGKTAISLQTPESMDCLQRQNGNIVVPIVALGCAHKVDCPFDLSFLGPCPREARQKLKPYDSEAAYKAIKKFL